MSNFTIPEGDSNRIENVELIPVGMNLCTLYSVVDLGTQDTKFGPKRQIKLSFEFPLEKRVFWEGEQPRPSVISSTETMSLADKANLRKKFIEPMIGRTLGKEETYDPTSLLGANFVATVTHSPDGKWANISSIVKLDDRNMMLFGLQQPSFPNVNPISKFHLNDGFMSENFAKLPNRTRNTIMSSTEGEQHKMSGGQFAEQIKTDGTTSQTPPVGGKRVIMNSDSPYTYESLKANNWTDDDIVAKNLGKWEVATPPAQPQSAPQAPSAPSAPQAPTAPQAPPTSPTPPTAPKHPVIMNDPAQQDKIDVWLANGWTYEMMVQQNHATMVK